MGVGAGLGRGLMPEYWVPRTCWPCHCRRKHGGSSSGLRICRLQADSEERWPHIAEVVGAGVKGIERRVIQRGQVSEEREGRLFPKGVISITGCFHLRLCPKAPSIILIIGNDS